MTTASSAFRTKIVPVTIFAQERNDETESTTEIVKPHQLATHNQIRFDLLAIILPMILYWHSMKLIGGKFLIDFGSWNFGITRKKEALLPLWIPSTSKNLVTKATKSSSRKPQNDIIEARDKPYGSGARSRPQLQIAILISSRVKWTQVKIYLFILSLKRVLKN